MTERQGISFMRAVARFEEMVLCLLLGAMILLACVQIGLRVFFSTGFLWADPLLRYMVLWSGLLGAVMASGRGEHIALDLAGYLIPERFQPLVQLCCHLFSFVTACALTYAALLFLQSEIEYGSPGLLDIPSWGWNLIFVPAFGLIALRYLLLTTGSLRMLVGRRASTPGDGQ